MNFIGISGVSFIRCGGLCGPYGKPENSDTQYLLSAGIHNHDVVIEQVMVRVDGWFRAHTEVASHFLTRYGEGARGECPYRGVQWTGGHLDDIVDAIIVPKHLELEKFEVGEWSTAWVRAKTSSSGDTELLRLESWTHCRHWFEEHVIGTRQGDNT